MTDKSKATLTVARQSLRAWAEALRTPEWQVRAAETVARLHGVETDALTETEFRAAIERVL